MATSRYEVLLDLFLRNKFFSILQVLGYLLLDFLGRVFSSFSIQAHFVSLSLISPLIRLL